jgi:hypothetical protein
VFHRRWRAGPLPVDPMAGFVDQERRVARARMQLVEVPRHEHAVGIAPRADADSAAGVNGSAAVGWIVIGAEIRAPFVATRAGGRGQPLRPPRFPVTLRELVTKKVIGPLGVDGITLSLAPQPATRTQNKTADRIFIAHLVRSDLGEVQCSGGPYPASFQIACASEDAR